MGKITKRNAHSTLLSTTLSILLANSSLSPTLASIPPKNIQPTPPGALQKNEENYTLGSGDIITIKTFEAPEYSGDFQIPVDSVINLPLIGTIFLYGLTLREASNLISSKYATVLKRPIVTVSLKRPRPVTISISGEVTRPGVYNIPLAVGSGFEPEIRYPTVAEAIKLADGFRLSADLTSIRLQRHLGNNPPQVIQINLKELLQTGNKRSNITLRDGDVIIVPATNNIEAVEARLASTANFAADTEKPRTIAILGAVKRPGTYVIIGGNTGSEIRTVGLPTITRALQLAKGIKSDADVRRIQVRRVTRDGKEQLLEVNLWKFLQNNETAQDIILQEGDTITVPIANKISPTEIGQLASSQFAPTEISVYVVGEVRVDSGGGDLIKLPSNATLNQAILAVGGFNTTRANKEAVELIRLNSNGTVFKRTIAVDFSKGMNETNNPLLQDNDIILVHRSSITAIVDSLDNTLRFSSSALGTIGVFIRALDVLDVFGIKVIRPGVN